MDQPNNKINLISNDTTQTTKYTKYMKSKECSECKRIRKPSDENHRICPLCYDARKLELSGSKVIDDFIKYTQTNYVHRGLKMEFVPYDKFKNVEFIAEGGFSKIYKANWVAGECQHIVLKKLNNSKNITSKELNEVRTILYTNLIMLR
jgi:hypothetical protein